MDITAFGKLLVLVPHQDDELLLTAGLLHRAAMAEMHPMVAMVTNGDYGCTDHSVGYARLRETIEGLSLIGVPATDLTLLGYADTGMPREDSFLAGLYEETDENCVHPSHCGVATYGLPEMAEFHMAQTGEHAPYTRASVAEDLRLLIDVLQPDSIITMALCDTHGDHSGLFEFTRDELVRRAAAGEHVPALYVGVVHSPAGDENWPLRDGVRPLTRPDGLEEASNLVWSERIVMPVPEDMCSEDMNVNLKYRAISCHRTALKPDAVDFLYSFVKADEVFWKVTV